MNKQTFDMDKYKHVMGKTIGGMKCFLEYTSFWIQWGFWSDLITRFHICHPILHNGLQSLATKGQGTLNRGGDGLMG